MWGAGVVDGLRQLDEAEMPFALVELRGAAGLAAGADLQGQPQRWVVWSWLQCVIGMGFSTGCAMSFCQPDDGHCSSEKKKMRELGRQGE